jgi:hypothetical protein
MRALNPNVPRGPHDGRYENLGALARCILSLCIPPAPGEPQHWRCHEMFEHPRTLIRNLERLFIDASNAA